MMNSSKTSGYVLGLSIFLGLIGLGYLIGNAALQVKGMERSVTVKGLSEKEVMADTVIWPIQFSAAENDLTKLYTSLERQTAHIIEFLEKNGIAGNAISTSPPTLTDKSAQNWGNNTNAEFRYTALQNLSVYSNNIESTRKVMSKMSELGKGGIVLTGGNYQMQPEYLYTKLNDIKPEMIEEATKKARLVAEKFADDSQSRLGKIKQASQGQFSISARDKNNPHIKKIRVVSTVEYYLSD
jgi:hypothetical protein